jgi:hypothetical protein
MLAALDFATASDELLLRLQAQFAADFNDFSVSSLAIILLDLEAYGLDGLGYYLDRRALEAYLATATTRQATTRLCRQLGYKMRGGLAASVDLTVTVPDLHAFAVPIPKGFLIRGPNGLVYEVARAVTFLAGETGGAVAKNLPCFEGQSFAETFVADGTVNQSFMLRRAGTKFVVAGTVVVAVNGTTWSEVEFLTFGATPQFEVGYTEEPPRIRFGSGSVGAIPPSGATVQVSYFATSGVAGRVAKETLTEPVTPLVVNFATITLTLSNPAASVGGNDPETIDEARQNAPRTWKARNVAITQGDYEGLARSYADPLAGRVAVAQAYATRSADQDLALGASLRSIRDAAGAARTPTQTSLVTLRARLASITASLASIQNELTAAAANASATDTEVQTLLTATRQVETLAANLSANATSIATAANTIKPALAAVSIVTSPSPEQLYQATVNGWNALLDSILAAAAVVGTAGGAVAGQVSAIVGAVANARSFLRGIGLDTSTAGSSMATASTQRATAAAAVGVASPASGCYADAAAIEAVVVVGATSTYATIDAACTAIFDHVDAILADDCTANLVTVPILTRDAGGFLAAPSTTLVQSLQGYLNARREVTQTVSVVSGAEALILVVLSLRVGVRAGASLSLVESAVGAAVDGILRDRRFGANLYLSDFRDVGGLEGVSFLNVEILGYYGRDGVTLLTDKLDSSGNLLVQPSEVVTKGRVSVAVEPTADSGGG